MKHWLSCIGGHISINALDVKHGAARLSESVHRSCIRAASRTHECLRLNSVQGCPIILHYKDYPVIVPTPLV
jgi:hypothetical protein